MIAAFGRHHLKVEKFTRATNCPPVCATAKGIPLAATELQFTESRRAFVFDVLVYRTEADAKRVISPALLKNGKDLLRVRIRYLRHGNIVVTYVGDTSRALPAIQKLFEEPGARLKAIQASLASLALPH